MRSRILAGFFLGILLIGAACAGFDFGNLSHSIEKSYGSGGFVRGWVNMSFADESADSLFETSRGDTISLLGLLETSDADYDCTPSDCLTGYSASNSETTKTFDLGARESAIVGIKLKGNVESMDSINLEIDSDAGASCSNQIEIDFFADGEVEFGNSKFLDDVCPQKKTYGCFNSSKSSEEISIGETPYCQRMELASSPGFNLGAWVKKSGTDAEIRMSLYSSYDNAEVGSCVLPPATGTGGEIFCNISYAVINREDYYVCVSAEGGSDYKIKGYGDSLGVCGFNGYPQKKEIGAYNLFVVGKKFGAVQNVIINNSLGNWDSLSANAQEYLQERYGNEIQCPSEGCIIPLRINSYVSQEVSLKNLEVIYKRDLGKITTNNFWDLAGTSAKVSSDFQKIFLDDANFSVGSTYGNRTFELEFDGEEIFSDKISIQELPQIKSLSPTETIAVFPTPFRVSISSSANISEYRWDFGDEKTTTTTTSSATHAYDEIGTYDLKVGAVDSLGRISERTFEISVGSPEEVINSTLWTMQKNLEAIKNEIGLMDDFSKKAIASVLDVDGIENDIKQFRRDYTGATEDEDYIILMGKILEVGVPESVYVGRSADALTFYPSEDNVDIDTVVAVSKEIYESAMEGGYVQAILEWNQENIATKIDFREIAAKYGDEERSLVRTFKLDISEKNSLGYNSYILIKNMDGLGFNENYLENEISDYYSIEIKGASKNVLFYTSEEVDFSDVPVFISPPLKRLFIKENIERTESGTSKWVVFGLMIFLLLIVGAVVYIFLQQWYKTRYETYLFKNRNYLYNIAAYIEKSKKEGVTLEDIEAKLRKAGWSGEQVDYALKKYAGKRTGMWELPFSKLLGRVGVGKVPEKTAGKYNN